MTFSEKISILAPTNSDDFVLVIGQVFRIFRIFTLLDVVTILSSQEKHLFPFSRQKFLMTFTFFYSVHYFRPHPTTLLHKILGGRMHGPSPHLKTLGGIVPLVPLGFRH